MTDEKKKGRNTCIFFLKKKYMYTYIANDLKYDKL